MAKLVKTLQGDYDQWLLKIVRGVVDGNISAHLEDTSDFKGDNARCSVRVFERYSALGGNRVSLSVTLFQSGDGPIYLSAITAGGSQGLFCKINTFGENAFLNKFQRILEE